MLLNSFSYLPVLDTRDKAPMWKLLSDVAVARYLRGGDGADLSGSRLAKTVEEALATGKLDLQVARILPGTTPIAQVLTSEAQNPCSWSMRIAD